MTRLKKVLTICLSIITLLIVLGSVVIYCVFFTSPFDSLNQRDYKNFAEIGKKLFLLYDKGNITIGETIHDYDYEDKLELKKALSKYKRKVAAVYFVDKNVMLLSFGATFQSVEGIAITRNNAELKDTYENTGFDTGTLRYSELIPNVYHFNAGL